MYSWKIWLRRYLLMVGSLLGLCVAINLLIDPFDIYRLVSIDGINSNKSMATKHPRIIKPYQVARLRPAAVALGSSRTEVGIDPDHPGWDARYRPVFNYALGGANIMELADRFESQHRISPLRQVVVGLDFFMFNAYAANPVDSPGDGANMNSLNYLTTSLLTMDTLSASVETLRKQNPVKNPGVRPNGQIDWTFNTRRVAKYGHRNGFKRFLVHFLEEMYFPLPAKKYAFVLHDRGVSSIDALRRIVATARRDGVDLRLFISPMHAQLGVVIDQLGLWSVYEDWKRQLVTVLDEDAAAHPGQAPFVLWDFSGFNRVTTEVVPAAGDNQTQMNYFWECSHYKKETGDLILDRIFDFHDASRMLPQDFGIHLRRDNIDAFLAATRAGLADYRQHYPEEINAIAKLKSQSTWLTE